LRSLSRLEEHLVKRVEHPIPMTVATTDGETT
jgi:hypothetical protein